VTSAAASSSFFGTFLRTNRSTKSWQNRGAPEEIRTPDPQIRSFGQAPKPD
jgi:hypothetical protein